jgi:hypothetical protein
MGKNVFLLMLVFVCCGCSNVTVQPKDTKQWTQQADAIRAHARAQFEQGDPRAALASIRKALRISSNLELSSINLVEIYDDAGLYFYMNKQWRAAARYQAIAVLLACNQNESAELFSEYIHRLSFAFSAYSPKESFDSIAKNPLWLISDTDLNLYKNIDIRRRFFTSYPIFSNKINAHKVAYKLNPESLPASCYYHAKTKEE